MQAGDKLPTFKLPDETEAEREFKDLAGANGLVIWFYPKDLTPG